MISIKECSGCGNCEKVCPKHAIKMEENEEGFLYPCLDSLLCIDCNVCEKVCPIINSPRVLFSQKDQLVYAGYSINKDNRCTSSSGGIFSTIADYIIENNGFVIGAAFDEYFYLSHICINKKSELIKLKGSKYFQSELNDIFTDIEILLKKDKLVYFCGTPCQVSALKLYLKNDYKNLITTDLICHGVPSKNYFNKYKEYLEKKYNAKLEAFYFRDYKKWGERERFILIKKNKKIVRNQPDYCSSFLKGFLSGGLFRDICYDCCYAKGARCGDISIGDFWGIQNISKINYEKGCSAILVNSEKGYNLFNNIKNRLIFEKRTFNEVSKRNSNLLYPTKKPDIRNVIYNEMEINGIDYIFKKYFKISNYYIKKFNYYIGRILGFLKIKRIIKRIVSR